MQASVQGATFSTHVIIQVRGERVLCENRLNGKRQSDQRKQQLNGVRRGEKSNKKVRKDAKIGRIQREEREREQGKA